MMEAESYEVADKWVRDGINDRKVDPSIMRLWIETDSTSNRLTKSWWGVGGAHVAPEGIHQLFVPSRFK